jgi:hypothetical protein
MTNRITRNQYRAEAEAKYGEPVRYSHLIVDDIVVFGSCTTEWVVREFDGWTALTVEQIKGNDIGHTRILIEGDTAVWRQY